MLFAPESIDTALGLFVHKAWRDCGSAYQIVVLLGTTAGQESFLPATILTLLK